MKNVSFLMIFILGLSFSYSSSAKNPTFNLKLQGFPFTSVSSSIAGVGIESLYLPSVNWALGPIGYYYTGEYQQIFVGLRYDYYFGENGILESNWYASGIFYYSAHERIKDDPYICYDYIAQKYQAINLALVGGYKWSFSSGLNLSLGAGVNASGTVGKVTYKDHRNRTLDCTDTLGNTQDPPTSNTWLEFGLGYYF